MSGEKQHRQLCQTPLWCDPTKEVRSQRSCWRRKGSPSRSKGSLHAWLTILDYLSLEGDFTLGLCVLSLQKACSHITLACSVCVSRLRLLDCIFSLQLCIVCSHISRLCLLAYPVCVCWIVRLVVCSHIMIVFIHINVTLFINSFTMNVTLHYSIPSWVEVTFTHSRTWSVRLWFLKDSFVASLDSFKVNHFYNHTVYRIFVIS